MKNFEEIINEYIQIDFSNHPSKIDDIAKEKLNLNDEETKFLKNKYREIYAYAEDLAFKWSDGKISQSVVRDEVRKKYPFLKQVIQDRIVERAMHASRM